MVLKKQFLLYFFIIFLISACSEKKQAKQPGDHSTLFKRDLEEIRKDGKLRVLIAYNSTSYFLYRGRPMGYEYELVKRLADHLNLKLELHVSKNMDSLINELNRGKADLLAYGLTITADRKKRVQFTDYLYLTHQVLVQKKPDHWRKMRWAAVEKSLIHDPIELIGDTVSVRENTSYFERIQNLSKEMGGKIFIDTLKGNISTDKIIKMVVDGDIKYTVADDNLAKINSSYYPILNIDVPISFSQRIAWAVRPNSPELLAAINKWIKQERKDVDYYVIYNKYFKNRRDFRKRVKSDFYSLNKNKISKYDPIIKKNAEKIHWDWRLLASQIYQESQFKLKASSWAGAQGLMQLTPETAEELGVINIHDPKENIAAGTDYLQQLEENFMDVEDSVQRMKFTLASFNCGYSHVMDAQSLAEERGLDSNRWDGNVEKMILALSYPENYQDDAVKFGYVRGIEPYTYVRQIFDRYNHYKNFIKR